jgi:hypothetical protein
MTKDRLGAIGISQSYYVKSYRLGRDAMVKKPL